MGKILFDSEEAPKAAEDWLKANPDALDAWLAGVTTLDGQPGLDAVKKSLGLSDHETAPGRPGLTPPSRPGDASARGRPMEELDHRTQAAARRRS